VQSAVSIISVDEQLQKIEIGSIELFLLYRLSAMCFPFHLNGCVITKIEVMSWLLSVSDGLKINVGEYEVLVTCGVKYSWWSV